MAGTIVAATGCLLFGGGIIWAVWELAVREIKPTDKDADLRWIGLTIGAGPMLVGVGMLMGTLP